MCNILSANWDLEKDNYIDTLLCRLLPFLTLVMMGGGALCAPQSVFIFLLKISPPDQTLSPTCKLLILDILYHEFFFLLKI